MQFLGFRVIVNKYSLIHTSGRGTAPFSPPQAKEAAEGNKQTIALTKYKSHVQILRKMLSEEDAHCMMGPTCRVPKVNVQIRLIKLSTNRNCFPTYR